MKNANLIKAPRKKPDNKKIVFYITDFFIRILCLLLLINGPITFGEIFDWWDIENIYPDWLNNDWWVSNLITAVFAFTGAGGMFLLSIGCLFMVLWLGILLYTLFTCYLSLIFVCLFIPPAIKSFHEQKSHVANLLSSLGQSIKSLELPVPLEDYFSSND